MSSPFENLADLVKRIAEIEREAKSARGLPSRKRNMIKCLHVGTSSYGSPMTEDQKNIGAEALEQAAETQYLHGCTERDVILEGLAVEMDDIARTLQASVGSACIDIIQRARLELGSERRVIQR